MAIPYRNIRMCFACAPTCICILKRETISSYPHVPSNFSHKPFHLSRCLPLFLHYAFLELPVSSFASTPVPLADASVDPFVERPSGLVLVLLIVPDSAMCPFNHACRAPRLEIGQVRVHQGLGSVENISNQPIEQV